MDAIGRTNDTPAHPLVPDRSILKAVDKSITDVTEDDPIFYLAGMEPKADAPAASGSSTNGA